MGWIGGRYSTSKPMAARSGSRASHVGEGAVPARRRCRPSAGSSSYQVLKRARSRSTSTVHSGWIVAVRCGPASGSIRVATARRPRRSAVGVTGEQRRGGGHGGARRRGPRRGAAASSTRAAPIWQVDDDVLAGLDLGEGSHQPRAEGVDPGLDREAVEAEALDREGAVQWSLPRGTRATADQRPPGGRCRRRAATVSLPSVKTSAVTTTSSPLTRLTGKRPPSTTGATCSMTTRDPRHGAAGRAHSPGSSREVGRSHGIEGAMAVLMVRRPSSGRRRVDPVA